MAAADARPAASTLNLCDVRSCELLKAAGDYPYSLSPRRKGRAIFAVSLEKASRAPFRKARILTFGPHVQQHAARLLDKLRPSGGLDPQHPARAKRCALPRPDKREKFVGRDARSLFELEG